MAYDMEILPPWQVPGRPTTDRCFVIADEGIQITRPVTFVDALEGGWYIDLVELEEVGPKRLAVHDLYKDKHLRNLNQDAPNSWPDFPPAALVNLAELPPFD
ncbi:hypothetical protein [Streptomyces prunicolor]